MAFSRIGPDYELRIPEEYRSRLAPGKEVSIDMDSHGRLVITPLSAKRSILDNTFGIWVDRNDLPKSGIEYTDEIRRSKRLNQLYLRDSDQSGGIDEDH